MMQTDIEIYIKSASPDAIKLWLEICTSRLDVQSSNPKRQAYWATFADANNQQAEFEIIVLNKVQSNWANDKACAQEAFEHFQSTVRCVVSSWQEGDAPDQWLSIDAQGESTIDWL